MLFYRVEHRDTCEGPYQSRHSFHEKDATHGPAACCILSTHSPDNGRPGPWDDGLQAMHEDDLFGFRNLAQARRWFTVAVRTHLAALGFVLRRFKVSRRVDGQRQSVAPRGTLEATLDLVTFKVVS